MYEFFNIAHLTVVFDYLMFLPQGYQDKIQTRAIVSGTNTRL